MSLSISAALVVATLMGGSAPSVVATDLGAPAPGLTATQGDVDLTTVDAADPRHPSIRATLVVETEAPTEDWGPEGGCALSLSDATPSVGPVRPGDVGEGVRLASPGVGHGAGGGSRGPPAIA